MVYLCISVFFEVLLLWECSVLLVSKAQGYFFSLSAFVYADIPASCILAKLQQMCSAIIGAGDFAVQHKPDPGWYNIIKVILAMAKSIF